MNEDIELNNLSDTNAEPEFALEWEANSTVISGGKLITSRNTKNITSNGTDVFRTKYTDYQTIDWLQDRTLSKLRSLYFSEIYNGANFKLKLKIILDKISIWILLVLIGALGAIAGVIITVGVQYFSDLREGVCTTNVLHNRQTCCWKTDYDTRFACKTWLPWSDVFKLPPGSMAAFTANYIVYVIIAIIFALFSGIYVKELAPYAAGGGISEIKTILSGFIMHGYLGLTTYIVKSGALILSVASGIMIGQEGPMVHISCCIANVLTRFFPKFDGNEVDKRDVLSAGSAAGVAIAFGAPLSGVLFSLEETSFYFTANTLWRNFVVAMVGAFAVASLIPYSSGNLTIYKVVPADWHLFEIPLFALIGVFGGLYGALFTRCNVWWTRYKKRFNIHNYPLQEIAIITMISALLCFPFELSRASNHHIISYMFTNCIYRNTSDGQICEIVLDKFQNLNPYPLENSASFVKDEMLYVIYTFIVKAILLIFTFGIKVPSGLFIPSITLGALFGRLVGLTIETLSLTYPQWSIFKKACRKTNHRCIFPSNYAIVGGAAVLGGITQTTVCAVILMIEITGSLSYILPLILAVMTAKWVFNALLKEGIYEEISKTNNYPYLSNKDEISIPFLVKEGLSLTFKEPIISIRFDGVALPSLIELILNHPFSVYPIVTSSNQLHGVVTRNEILSLLNDKLTQIPPTDHANTNIYFSSSLTYSSNESNEKANNICLKHLMDPSPITVNINAPLNIVIYIFQKIGVHHVFVTDRGHLKGIITRKDAIIQLRHFLHLS